MNTTVQFGLTKYHQGVVTLLQQLGVDWTILRDENSSCSVMILPPNEDDAVWNDVSLDKPTIDYTGRLARRQGVTSGQVHLTHLLDTPWNQHSWDVPIHPITVRTYPKAQSLHKSMWIDEPSQSCHIGLPFWSHSQQFQSWMAPMGMEQPTAPPTHRPTERIHQIPYALHRNTLLYAMRHACVWAGVPLLRKAMLPKGVSNLFIVRVDSDYGTKDSVEALQNTLKSYDLPSTWFLHTEAHKGWLEMFIDPFIEIAVHGVRHQSRGSSEALYRNIMQSKQEIEIETGIRPTGVAVPFGHYTPQISEVYKQCKDSFLYASDFGFDSDNVPHWPNEQEPLQVPIHPICPGSFRRTKASHEQIQQYFLHKLHSSMHRGEPFIFYHHPLQEDMGVLTTLFERVAELRQEHLLEAWTLHQWADWWAIRSKATPYTTIQDPNANSVKWVSEEGFPKQETDSESLLWSYNPLDNPLRQWKSILLDELGQRTQ